MTIDTIDKDRALAITLLAEYRKEIAESIVKFTRRLEPRWTSVPAQVAEKSAANQLRAVEDFLRTSDSNALLETIRDLVRLRKHVGFAVGDFAVKSHAYLPIIRKTFLKSNRLSSEVMRSDDVVESAMLPLIARILQELANAPDEASVDELEDSEDTVPGGRAPHLVSLNPFTMVDIEADMTNP